MDEETLNRLAAEALMEEAKVGARRAEIMGPSGWIKPRETINKRFLHSTIRNVVLSNRQKQRTRNKYHESHSNKDNNHMKLEKINDVFLRLPEFYDRVEDSIAILMKESNCKILCCFKIKK